MPLTVKNPVTAALLSDIHVLKAKKVIKLIGKDGEAIVIKKEDRSVTVDQIKGAKAVMKAVDPSFKLKLLSAEEADQIIEFARSILQEYQTDEALRLGDKKAKIEDLEILIEIMEQWKDDIGQDRSPVLKLDYMDVKSLHAEYDKRMATVDKNKTGLRQFVSGLNRAGGFEMLGQVIVADFTMMNGDRFNPRGGAKFKLPKGDTSLKTIVNVGNIFMRMTDLGPKPTGLDFLDPYSELKSIDKSVAHIRRDSGEYWLEILADKAGRNELAANIVEDLEKIVNPKRGRFNFIDKLDSKAAKRIVAGFVEGARLIAAELDRKYKSKPEKGNRWTPGVQERYDILIAVTQVT